MKTSSKIIRILKPLSSALSLSRPVIQKWTGEEYEDMEAEFDNIDENEGGMILFKVKKHLTFFFTKKSLQEFCNWAFSKNFDLEDDIDSEEEAE